MNLKLKAIKELQGIMQRDYSVLLSEDQAIELGASLLRLSRLASVAQARGEKIITSPIEAKATLSCKQSDRSESSASLRKNKTG